MGVLIPVSVFVQHHRNPYPIRRHIRHHPDNDLRRRTNDKRRQIVVSGRVKKFEGSLHMERQRVRQRQFINAQFGFFVYEPCSERIAEDRRQIDPIANRIRIIKHRSVIDRVIEPGPHAGDLLPAVTHRPQTLEDLSFRTFQRRMRGTSRKQAGHDNQPPYFYLRHLLL